MKKILAVALLAISNLAAATTTVQFFWPFSPASNQANALRMIIENANKAQDKYQFVFENKPGAGGSIATNTVINSDKLSLMMISTSVFVRPHFYPTDSHNVDDLVPVAITSTGSPIVIISKKYSSLADLKAANASIGVVAGSITEAVARRVGGLNLIPYPGTINATRDAVGGHIDASVEFIKDSLPWIESGDLKPVGMTGKKAVKPFAVTIPETGDLVTNYYVVTNKKVTQEILEELNQIIMAANNQPNVRAIWSQDFATTETMSLKAAGVFWEEQKRFWKNYK